MARVKEDYRANIEQLNHIQEGAWVTGIYEGYRTKTIRGSNWVAQINRPILTDEERKKAEARLQDALDEFARSYALCTKGGTEHDT